MNILDCYAEQAELRDTGAYIDGRVRKAAKLFQKHLGRAQTLLDIGCGIGVVGLYLGNVLSAEEVFGVEIAESRVAEAQRRGMKAIRVDLNHMPLPFRGGNFDAVFCGETIEHLLDPDRLIEEIGRVLRPGGVCVLTTPNLAAWYNRIALVCGWQPFHTSVSFRHEVGRPKFLVTEYGCRDHIRVFTFKALCEFLAVHEFQILDARGCCLADAIVPSMWNTRRLRNSLYRILSPLDLLMSRRPSLSTGVVVAIKKG